MKCESDFENGVISELDFVKCIKMAEVVYGLMMIVL